MLYLFLMPIVMAFIYVLSSFILHYNKKTGGPRWRSWLRHCATSQNVAGSIPDGVIGIFH